MTKHPTVEGHWVRGYDYLKNPGDYMFGTGILYFVCPCGGHTGEFDEKHTFVPIVQKGQEPPKGVYWEWDGDGAHPTLSPSVRRVDGCKWHGHLQKGVWIPCNDSGE